MTNRILAAVVRISFALLSTSSFAQGERCASQASAGATKSPPVQSTSTTSDEKRG